MSTAPALIIRAGRQGAWRLGVAALAALSTVTVLAWWGSGAERAPGWSGIAVAACLLATGAAVLGLCTGTAPGLRWDGRHWWLSAGDGAALAGDVSVALDLGGWMLLRFAPLDRPGAWRTHWVALQRSGLEGDWHALRCTLHAERAGQGGVRG